MYPGMLSWWKHARRSASCGASAGCGPSGERWSGEHWAHAGPDHDGELGGGGFGVRRPLRFLAFKLELEEKQVAELATILNELKTERAQAAVDNRRTTSAFADAIAGDTFDEERVASIASQRVKSAEVLRDAVAKALKRIHAILTADQRAKLAYLIRTGALTL